VSVKVCGHFEISKSSDINKNFIGPGLFFHRLLMLITLLYLFLFADILILSDNAGNGSNFGQYILIYKFRKGL
jgi:hypothetical protein